MVKISNSCQLKFSTDNLYLDQSSLLVKLILHFTALCDLNNLQAWKGFFFLASDASENNAFALLYYPE